MRSSLALGLVSLLWCAGCAGSPPAPTANPPVGPAVGASGGASGGDPGAMVDGVGTAPRWHPVVAPAPASRLPREGDQVLDLRVYYGIPILQRSFFWDGNGETDQFGLKTRYLWHTSDNTALGVGLTLSNFLVGGADVQAAEFEAVGRFRVYTDEDFAVFVETAGGWLQATEGIPPGGTEWNMTFSFGPGVDIPIGDRLDLVTGVTYHHISNALGHENVRNPSQNEAQLWIGMDFRF